MFENAAALTAIFGELPSFHDAEVMRLTLDRAGSDGPTLDALIHVFEMTSEIDAKGFYVLKSHTEVSLRFTEVRLDHCRWFNHQNVLHSLEINQLNPTEHDGRKFGVTMSASYGLEAEFKCARAIVLGVRPFEPAGEQA